MDTSQPSLFAMSFNRRKSCFVCGRQGHLADACSSPARVCFNCGELNHERSACPAPKTDDHKVCYICNGIGHIAASCPTGARAGPRPFRGPPGAGVGGPVAAGKGCFTCGGPHLAKQCPKAAAANRGCFNCGGPHLAKACRLNGGPGGAPRPRGPKLCHVCKQPGHIARECPTTADPPAAVDAALATATPVVPAGTTEASQDTAAAV
ncbi:unnamed protein product [Sympodiomycopsis kandeliae]